MPVATGTCERQVYYCWEHSGFLSGPVFSTHLSLDYKINYLEKVFPPLCHLHKWPPGPTD